MTALWLPSVASVESKMIDKDQYKFAEPFYRSENEVALYEALTATACR